MRRRLGIQCTILALAGFILLVESWRAVQAPRCGGAAGELAGLRARSQLQLQTDAAAAMMQQQDGAAETGSLPPSPPPLPEAGPRPRFQPINPQRLAALAEACGLPPARPMAVKRVTNIAVLGERHSGKLMLLFMCLAPHATMSLTAAFLAALSVCYAGTNLVHQLVHSSMAGLIYNYPGLRRCGHKHFFQVPSCCQLLYKLLCLVCWWRVV